MISFPLERNANEDNSSYFSRLRLEIPNVFSRSRIPAELRAAIEGGEQRNTRQTKNLLDTVTYRSELNTKGTKAIENLQQLCQVVFDEKNTRQDENYKIQVANFLEALMKELIALEELRKEVENAKQHKGWKSPMAALRDSNKAQRYEAKLKYVRSCIVLGSVFMNPGNDDNQQTIQDIREKCEPHLRDFEFFSRESSFGREIARNALGLTVLGLGITCMAFGIKGLMIDMNQMDKMAMVMGGVGSCVVSLLIWGSNVFASRNSLSPKMDAICQPHLFNHTEKGEAKSANTGVKNDLVVNPIVGVWMEGDPKTKWVWGPTRR